MKRAGGHRALYLQVLVAIALGVLIGHFWPAAGLSLKPLGDAFIKLIRMLIGPVIFCTVVLGIAGMESMRKVGKVGGLALLYFELMSTMALIAGLAIVNIVRPGAGLHADASRLDAHAVAPYVARGSLGTVSDFLLHVIPDTFFSAFATGDILQVLLISVLLGFALHRIGRDSAMFRGVESFAKVLFGIVSIVMRAAPLGALGAMAFTVGKYGLASLWSLGKLMFCFYATCLLFVFGVLGAVARAHGFSVTRLIAYLRDELLIVLGTSSSESVLPRLMLRLESLGVRKSVVGLVIPTGYSFNLDGTSIYLTMAALFVAQATDTPLSFAQQLLLLAVLLLTSKGAAGVTGSGFIVLAATLGAVGHVPVAGLALILGIDRFMSEARALTNLVGNAVAAIVVGRWCQEVDLAQLRRVLQRAPAAEPDQA